MTKFEEEFKALTSWDWINVDLIQQILAKFGNWHSDEEFQEMKESYWNQAESILSMLEEIKSLKSQLQQQALPVVPEDVAKWIEDLKSKGYGPLKNPGTYGEAISDLSDESLEKILTWISQHQEEFMRAWLDGYTVEKPKLFYLKHIDFCKRDKDYDWYMIKHSDGPLNHLRVEKGTLPPTVDSYFTKQEIDSMETGSYEQIEVAE